MDLSKRQAVSEGKKWILETDGPVDEQLIKSFYHFTKKETQFIEQEHARCQLLYWTGIHIKGDNRKHSTW